MGNGEWGMGIRYISLFPTPHSPLPILPPLPTPHSPLPIYFGGGYDAVSRAFQHGRIFSRPQSGGRARRQGLFAVRRRAVDLRRGREAVEPGGTSAARIGRRSRRPCVDRAARLPAVRGVLV